MDPRDFDEQRAEWIALQYSFGDSSLQEIHTAHHETVPPPLFIQRWRDKYPSFNLLMVEAERARALTLVDQTIGIADDKDRQAAQARNAVQVRQWMAARLDRKRFGTEHTLHAEVSGSIAHEHIHTLTDAQLQQIAAGDVLEGEAERLDHESAPPRPPA